MINKEITIDELISLALQKGDIIMKDLLYIKNGRSDEEILRRLKITIKDNNMADCINKTIDDVANGILGKQPELITLYDDEELNSGKYDVENTVKKEVVKEVIKETSVIDKTYKPDYYKSGDMDVIAFCQYHNLDFSTGNCIKYLVRVGKKENNSKLQDLKKAKEYLERLIEYASNTKI